MTTPEQTAAPDMAAIMAADNPLLAMAKSMPDEVLVATYEALGEECERRGLLETDDAG